MISWLYVWLYMSLSVQADLEAGDTQIDEESDLEACKLTYWSLGFSQVEESCDF